jgi:two-component system response regulator AtoC
VLIRGETGTGKEIAARTIHRLSSRRDGPFIKVHCAALPDALLESELFGYEKGAFTGAAARKPGRVELAQGGTLFLDEIGDVTPAVQIKLLRVLQDREFERLGGTETLRTDARFCAATHRDLEGMIQRGEFREDLFYRLNVVPLWIPPLRARRPDIDALTRAFCARFGSAHGKPGVTFDDDAMRALRRERWPGNVRQLQNFVERLVVLTASSVITLRDVTDELSRQVRFVTQAPSSIVAPQAAVTPDDGSLEEQVRHAEREALKRALDRAKGNRTVAARILGINRRTLYNKIVEYELGDENQDE